MAIVNNSSVDMSLTDSSYTNIVNLTELTTFDAKVWAEVERSKLNDVADGKCLGSYTTALAFNVRMESGGGGQSLIEDAHENGTEYWFRVRPVIGSGEKEYRFQGFITNRSQPANRNNEVIQNITVTPDGAVTIGTQP
jgi:hypothetical protein